MSRIFTRAVWKSEKIKRTVAMVLISAAAVFWLASYIVRPTTNPPGADTTTGDIFPGGGNAVEGHLPNMTEEDIREQMQREADKGIFAFKINSRPVFENGDAEGTLRIENPNHNTYPFVVKIFLSETEEEIYNSGGMLPNHHIDVARLTKVLPKGEHAAMAYIYAYDPETNEYGGKAAVELTLIVTL